MKADERIAYTGEKHDLVVYTHGDHFVVEVTPKGPTRYVLPPFYRWVPIERAWWKPWTWFGSLDGAVRSGKRWVERRDRRERRNREALASATLDPEEADNLGGLVRPSSGRRLP